MARLRGLTWAHRRAIDPLKASARSFEAETGISIDWQVRSLQQFEHQSFADAVALTDLIVFDHPHIGDIVALGLLRPAAPDVAWAHASDAFVGDCLATYTAACATWALPVDAATVHAVYRPDLVSRIDAPLPTNWAESIAFMRKAKARGMTCLLAGGGHHLLLTLAGLMANIGHSWSAPGGTRVFIDRATLAIAIDLVDEALDACDRDLSLASNAIKAHELLATEPQAAFCPAAYGYATYGEAGIWPYRLAFAQFAGPGPVAHAGTIIGGAGVGVTKECCDPAAAAAYLSHLAGAYIQTSVFAMASGQPARVEAWSDPMIDGRFNGFFSATRATLELASVRPQFAGYPIAEQELADILQSYMAREISRAQCIDRMVGLGAGS